MRLLGEEKFMRWMRAYQTGRWKKASDRHTQAAGGDTDGSTLPRSSARILLSVHYIRRLPALHAKLRCRSL
jgi:hypothetical protein